MTVLGKGETERGLPCHIVLHGTLKRAHACGRHMPTAPTSLACNVDGNRKDLG